jgi:hypothetical protein
MFKFLECRHIMPSGRKCHSPALRGKPFCFYHAKLHFRTPSNRGPRMLKTIQVDDPHSLQAAVAETLTSLRSPLTDPYRAGVMLYGLHLANNLAKRISDCPRDEAIESDPGHEIDPGQNTDQAMVDQVFTDH